MPHPQAIATTHFSAAPVDLSLAPAEATVARLSAHILPDLAAIEVTPAEGSPWVALLERGPYYRGARSGLLAVGERGLLALVRGAAYMIQPAERGATLLAGGPITAALPAPGGEVVLATPWEVLCVDQTGLRWGSRRLATEGITLAGADDERVWGVSDPEDGGSRFVLLLKNGR
jgi:hypothetical protein